MDPWPSQPTGLELQREIAAARRSPLVRHVEVLLRGEELALDERRKAPSLVFAAGRISAFRAILRYIDKAEEAIRKAGTLDK